MKIVSQIQSVKVNLLNGLKINAPVKLLGGLALGAILITSVALSSGTTPASPLSANPVSEVVIDIDDLGGGITDFEEAYTSKVNVASDLGGGITDFEEPYVNTVRSNTDLGGGITDFEEPYVNTVRSSNDLGGGISDFEEPYVNAVRSSAVEVQWDLDDIFNSSSTGLTSEPVEVQWDLEDMFNAVRSGNDLGGGITDFEEPYVNAVRSSAVEVQWELEELFNASSTGLTSEPVEVQWDLEDMFNAVRSGNDLGGGITDFEEPYVNAVRSSSDLGGGITDFEEPYTSKVSSLPTQLVDIEDEGGTGRMFEPWEFSSWAGENEQANLFPEVEL